MPIVPSALIFGQASGFIMAVLHAAGSDSPIHKQHQRQHKLLINFLSQYVFPNTSNASASFF